MTKLSCVLAIAAMIGLAGCPKRNEDRKQTDQAMKTTDVAPTATTTDDKARPSDKADDKAKPDQAKPDQARPDDKTVTPAANAGLPAECAGYKEAMAKATACEKLGAQRDELKRQFDSSTAAWDKLDDAGRAQLAETCKKLAATVTSVTAAACP